MKADGRKWELTEQTTIRVRINHVQHTQFINVMTMTQRQETLIRARPGHRIHLALENMKKKHSAAERHTGEQHYMIGRTIA